MRIGEFDINRADGKILLNDIRLDTGILPRGHKLSKEDILYLKMTGIRKITAGEMGVADLSAENALSNLAPRIAGKNVVYVTPERNLCKIAADRDGIFICQENRLLKFNRMSSMHPARDIPAQQFLYLYSMVLRQMHAQQMLHCQFSF